MRRLDAFWRAIESTPVRAGVRAAWEEIAGSNFDLLRPFLRLVPEPATAYPCPDPQADGCPRAVVVHAPDDIVAVCHASPRRCETLSLAKCDLALYSLDLTKLGAYLGAQFGLKEERSRARGTSTTTVYLGTYCPAAGQTFPAYLTLQQEVEELARVLEELVARDALPFILFTFTADLVTPALVETARARRSSIVALADITTVDAAGHLVFDRPTDSLLAPLRDGVLTSSERERATFPTPAGTMWEQVEIRFRDGHTVSVKAPDAQGVFHYSQMGMASRKNAEPTVQWKLLKSFAEERGVLTWKSPHADRKNQKRRENLSRDLRSFFQIDDDPIGLTADGRGWRVRFALHDDG